MKIFMVEPVGDYGGMGHYDRSLCGSLTSAGHDVEWFTTEINGDYPTAFRVSEIFRGIYDKKKPITRSVRFFWGCFRLLSALASKKPDVAHFHCFRLNFMEAILLLLAKLCKVKTVGTIHDVEAFVGNKNSLIKPWMLKNFDKLIVHNSFSKESLLKIDSNLGGHCFIIPHGNYVDYVRHESSKSSLDGVFSILLFGQLKEVKGVDVLINAIGELRKLNADFPVKFKICGRPWHVSIDFYKKMADKVGASGFIEWDVRYVPDDEVHALYGAADLVVLPYKKIYQSGVLLLAMSYGKPVLVSDLPGMTEIVSDGFNGYVFEVNNSISLAKKIKNIVDDRADAIRVGEEGFNYVVDNHGWDKVAAGVIDCYLK